MTGKKKKVTMAARVSMMVTKGLSSKQYRSKAVIANRLGWSEGLVKSTLSRINEFEDATNAPAILSYDPRTQTWKLAATWEQDKEFYVRWLMQHIVTRIRTVVWHVEVATGLLPDSKKIPVGLRGVLATLETAADAVLSMLPQPSPTKAPMKVPSRTTYVK